MNEFLLWKGKANLKIGIIKMAGNIRITNERILFETLSKKIEIKMKEIKDASIEGKLIKRLRIESLKGNYSFFIPHAKDILPLIRNFIHK